MLGSRRPACRPKRRKEGSFPLPQCFTNLSKKAEATGPTATHNKDDPCRKHPDRSSSQAHARCLVGHKGPEVARAHPTWRRHAWPRRDHRSTPPSNSRTLPPMPKPLWCWSLMRCTSAREMPTNRPLPRQTVRKQSSSRQPTLRQSSKLRPGGGGRCRASRQRDGYRGRRAALRAAAAIDRRKRFSSNQ